MRNQVEKKWFLKSEVRTVNDEYIVLKDVFSALGRLREDNQIQTTDRYKVTELVEFGIISAGENITISSKGKKQSKSEQSVDCVKISDVPLILTQFKPSKTKEGAIETWVEFMKFVNNLLTSLEVHKYIVTDKQKQLNHHELIVELGGKPVVENKMVNVIMAELIGIEGSIKKDELRTYQNQTTVDLLEVRDYVMNKFEQAYEIEESHSKAKEIAKRLAFKKYPMIKSA